MYDPQHQTLYGFAWMNVSSADFLEDNGSKTATVQLETIAVTPGCNWPRSDAEDPDSAPGNSEKYPLFRWPAGVSRHTPLPNPTAARSSPERRPSARASSERHDACLFDPVPRRKKNVRLKPAFAVVFVSAVTTKQQTHHAERPFFSFTPP